jgi:DNA-binding IclR family transcriptional regulator
MKKSATSSVQVIDRLSALLQALAENPSPLSLKVLAAETKLHPSTAFRILNSLADHGLVERSRNGHYQLGVKLLHLGHRVQGQVDLLNEARAIMQRLRSEIGETVNLTVREGNEVVYVERAIPNRMMRVEQVIGSRAPLHVTAVGKLFLGEAGESACRDYAKRTKLPRYTPNTLVGASALWGQAKKAWSEGVAHDNEEAELGVVCLGVPVRDKTGHMVAGLSISCPRERRQKEWAVLVKNAGLELSARLGFRASPV